MTVPPFRITVSLPPLSKNSDRSCRLREKWCKFIGETLAPPSGQTIFSGDAQLYGRIWYFNHDEANPRDIHNIIGPLFDLLEGYVYPNDKQIKHFEGFRLDMADLNFCFELELDLSAEPGLERANSETTCLIEIARLPWSSNSLVVVTWLSDSGG